MNGRDWSVILVIVSVVIVVALGYSLFADWKAQAVEEQPRPDVLPPLVSQEDLVNMRDRLLSDPSITSVLVVPDGGGVRIDVSRAEDGAVSPIVEEEEVPPPAPNEPPDELSLAATVAPTGQYAEISRPMLIDGSYMLLVDWSETYGGRAVYRYRPDEDDYILERWPLDPDEARSFDARPVVPGMIHPQTKAFSKGVLAQLIEMRPPSQITRSVLDGSRKGSSGWDLNADGIKGTLVPMSNNTAAMLTWAFDRKSWPNREAKAFYLWDSEGQAYLLHEYPIHR